MERRRDRKPFAVIERYREPIGLYLLVAGAIAYIVWSLMQVQEPMPAGTARPRGDVRSIFSAEDYPLWSILNADEGTVRTRLLVGSDGRVRQCIVLSSSGHWMIDHRTCSILKARARFTPAEDALGNPTESSYTPPPITWRLED